MPHHRKGSKLISDAPQQVYINLKESEFTAIRKLMKQSGVRTPSKWVTNLIRKELKEV